MPVGNVIGISTASVMMELQVPSKRRSLMGGTAKVRMLWVLANVESKKQCEEPESISVWIRIDNEGVFTLM